MTFRPRVSVIVPTYNRAHSIVAVVEAIMNQTYPVEEIIIADDGSTDDTMAALAELDYQAVRLLRLEHSGLPAVARNAALAIATGDWIAFCDSDDYWLPERLARQISARAPGSRTLCSNAWVISPGSKSSYLLHKIMPKLLNTAALLKTNWVINSSVLIEKNLLLEIGGIPSSPSLKFVEDYAAWLRVSSISPIQVADEPLIKYTDDLPNSMRGKQSFNHLLTSVIAWVDFLAWMRSRGQPLTMSEAAISVALPKLIAANMRLAKKPQR